jgi:5-methylcytosine-specific restriction endonuclease McrA
MSTAEYMKKYRETHREEIRANGRRFRAAHLKEERERVREWNKTPAAKISQKKYRDKVRAEVEAAYGGACKECGSPENLEVHHVHGNGNEHRRSIKRGAGQGFYRWLREQNFPPGFALLCYTCHRMKHVNTCRNFDYLRLVSAC